MFQGVMFGGEPVRVGRSGATQAALPFRGAVDSGRRGDPSADWLDLVLAAVRAAGGPVPTLAALQEQWNARRTAEQAARWIVAADKLARVATDARRQTRGARDARPERTRPTWSGPLALPAPVSTTVDASPLLTAVNLVERGASIRAAAGRCNVPVTTLRRALGRVTRNRA